MKMTTIMTVAALAMMALCGTARGDDGKMTGEVTLTGVITDSKNQSAKFNEYRDIRDGVYGSGSVRYDSPKQYFSLDAQDVGYGTQRYDLELGRWDVFKFRLNYDEIPHNFTYDARTFYEGAGTGNLSYRGAAPNTNPNGWGTFDYAEKRKNLGGMLKFDYLNPFYLDVSFDQQRKFGTYPLGIAGTSPGGIAVELPVNIDYTTNDFRVETGYVKKPFFLSAGYSFSQFRNGSGEQDFRNPATANTAAATDILYLPPDNNYYKLDFKGGVALPLQSKFNADISLARADSSTRLATSYVTDTTALASNIGIRGLTGISVSSPYFNGKVDTDNYHLALTSNPLSFLNTKLSYKYYNTTNRSDVIRTVDGTTIQTNDLFDYRKNIYGAETGWALPAHLRFTAAYTFTKTERNRDDLPKNRDNLFDVGLKWSGLSFMTAKIGYERLDRAAEFAVPGVTTTSLEYWVRRFDAAPQVRNTYKTDVEFFPLDNLSFNLGYRHRNTRYTDTILGLTDSKSEIFNADIDWLVHKRVRLSGYFDFEQRVLNQFQRQTTVNNDPATTPTSTSFNWTSSATENTFGYGISADIAIIPDKLTLKLSHNNVKSDGTVDYTYLLGLVPLPTGRNQDNIDLYARDTYRLNNYMAKLTYQVNKVLSVSATYAYEEYVYNDSQYDGYIYYISVTQGGYLTGAYMDPSYHNNIVFLSMNLKFK